MKRRTLLASSILAPFLRFLTHKPSDPPMPFEHGLPEHWFWNLWRENKDGKKIRRTDIYQEFPEGYIYAHACFPTQLVETCYRVRDDGGYGSKDEIYEGTTGWSPDLVNAMVRAGVSVEMAIPMAARSCERCMNVLLDAYGLDGYPVDSEEYRECGTSCDGCVKV